MKNKVQTIFKFNYYGCEKSYNQHRVQIECDDTCNYELIYSPSEELLKSIKKDRESMFNEFYEVFPVYVTRPDGTKGFLRANINKCRKEYNRIIGKSKAMHNHIMACLRYEIDDKMRTGKIGYMKTMWKWLTQHEWEYYEEQMNLEQQTANSYGTGIL